ncbi:MAG: hypothetical protein MUF42_13545 [Cytophagaceae bacterium]|jgi:hypothetical protein|nr:hypothetical protein [Cytophagaceae bacterium]
MITSLVGKTFLDAYNSKYNKQLTPKEFFTEEYFDLFYNHPKYMQWVTNSPFVQMKAGQKVHLLKKEERIEKLESLHDKVKNETADASFALGFPASESKEFASTSGLVSDIVIPVNEDEIYLSWIGSGLGIGVAGGYTLLFDDATITLQTFEGWKTYRKFLNDNTLERLRGNQIGTWNGQWLTYSLRSNFDEKFDFSTLIDEKIFEVDSEKIEVSTVNWSKLFFSLSQLYPSRSLTAYIYGFGQTNKTIGFIPFQLKAGTKLKHIYSQLIGSNHSISSKDFEELFGMHIKRACELGSIGMQTLRPEGLVKYMNESKNLTFKNEVDKINYYVYKTWLIAMLSKNKEEISEYTLKLAETILKYRNGDSNNKTVRKNLVEKELWEAKSKRAFIEILTTMIKDLDTNDLDIIKAFKDDIHLMTNEEFGYLSTLLKFDYAFLEKQS